MIDRLDQDSSFDQADGTASRVVRGRQVPVMGHLSSALDRWPAEFAIDDRITATPLYPNQEFPRLLALCPIFPPVRRKSQQRLLDSDHAMRFVYASESGRRFGPPVSVADEDTLMALMSLRQVSLRGISKLLPIPQHPRHATQEVHALSCTVGEINRALETQNGGLSASLRMESLKRLASMRIQLNHRRAGSKEETSEFKLVEVGWDRLATTAELYVQFTPAATRLLLQASVPVDLGLRRQLSEAGKAIHRYLCAQPGGSSIAVQALRHSIGYLKSTGSFMRQLRETLDRLEAKAWLRSYTIDGNGRGRPFMLTIHRRDKRPPPATRETDREPGGRRTQACIRPPAALALLPGNIGQTSRAESARSTPLCFGNAPSERAEAAARLLQVPLHQTQEEAALYLDDLERAATALELAAKFFGGDVERTREWFCAPNVLLGAVEPRMLVTSGRTTELLELVRQAVGARAEV